MANDVLPVALITGGARRIGAEIARHLHQAGYNLALHYHHSVAEAEALAAALNHQRPNSVNILTADLCNIAALQQLATEAQSFWGRVDVLINNASTFYPTPVGTVTEQTWDDLMGSNLKAPFFLAQALAEELKKNSGCIVNIADIHAERPLKEHPVYCAAKAGNIMLTKALARELAPHVRVNGVAPGAILWPEQQEDLTPQKQQDIVAKIPLQARGSAADIARSVVFLVQQAPYITGQILAVDGGRSVIS
jgi:pteridine reductase